jgi:hypothetical protein
MKMVRALAVASLAVAALAGAVGCGNKDAGRGSSGHAATSMSGWGVYKSDKFGFAMLVPPNTKWADRDYGNGWGAIATKTGVMEFVGLAKLNTFASMLELENEAIKLTKVPGPAWRKIDEGRNVAGWKDYRSYEAVGNGMVLLAVLGTGKKGSYILFMSTT